MLFSFMNMNGRIIQADHDGQNIVSEKATCSNSPTMKQLSLTCSHDILLARQWEKPGMSHGNRKYTQPSQPTDTNTPDKGFADQQMKSSE